LIAIILFALGAMGLVLVRSLTTPKPGVTWENYHRLRLGMSLGEVERILGRPGDVKGTTYYWTEKKVFIGLGFDADGCLENGGGTPNLAGANGIYTWEPLENR
jgi:hypothetical protein